MKIEIPPTAGLPLNWRDFFISPYASLAQKLSKQFLIPTPALTCSGTAALIVALRTLQQLMPERTEVIVPAYTCPLVALAAHYCPGIKVILCDLQPCSIDLDENALRTLCNEKTLAIVVTHLAGRIANVQQTKQIAEQVGARVIEDAAQAMGAYVQEQSVGLHGDIGFFSMAIGKGLTTAEGGVLFSHDPSIHNALHQRCKQDLPFNLKWEAWRTAQLFGYGGLYRPSTLYWIYGRHLREALAQGDEAGAVGDDFSIEDIPLHSLGKYRQRIGAAALERLPGYLQQGRERALHRIQRLQEIQGIRVLEDSAGQQGIWPFLMIVMPNAESRNKALEQLWTAGLGVTRLFIHTLPDYPDVRPLVECPLPIPNAKDFAARSLSITNSHWLAESAFEHIVNILAQTVGAQTN